MQVGLHPLQQVVERLLLRLGSRVGAAGGLSPEQLRKQQQGQEPKQEILDPESGEASGGLQIRRIHCRQGPPRGGQQIVLQGVAGTHQPGLAEPAKKGLRSTGSSGDRGGGEGQPPRIQVDQHLLEKPALGFEGRAGEIQQTLLRQEIEALMLDRHLGGSGIGQGDHGAPGLLGV